MGGPLTLLARPSPHSPVRDASKPARPAPPHPEADEAERERQQGNACFRRKRWEVRHCPESWESRMRLQGGIDTHNFPTIPRIFPIFFFFFSPSVRIKLKQKVE